MPGWTTSLAIGYFIRYFKRPSKYFGLEANEAKWLRELEVELDKLKKLLAE